MTNIIQEITEEGLQLPRPLLESLGYVAGRRMLIAQTTAGLLIRPAEATAEEIRAEALRYLIREVGDMAGVGEPEAHGNQWIVPVVIRSAGTSIGQLWFDLHGTLLKEKSASPSELADAADAA